MRTKCFARLCALVVVSSFGAISLATAGEGFGFLVKKTATLNRTVPPVVFIAGTKIAVKVTSQNPKHSEVAQRLQSLLESQLLSGDKRFTSEASHPETLVEVAIVQDEGSERKENRQVTEMRQTGKDSKGKAVFEPVQVTAEFKIVTHRFAAAYKVRDVKSGANLDADTIKADFENSFQEGKDAPEQDALESSAVNSTVSAIVRRMTPSAEKVGVLLPKGTLEGLSNLAEANLWSKYLEALEAMPPKQKAEDESYRQYALGLAYEALGYSAEDPETTLKYLQQASGYYNGALAANPKEKYFSLPFGGFLGSKAASAPLDRVRSALVEYQKTKEFKASHEQAKALKEASVSGGKSLASDGKSTDGFSNGSVIDMVKAGLSDDIILTSIDSAPHPVFDVSPQGLIELSQGNVSQKIIQHIQTLGRKRVTAPKHAPKPKPPA
ncbi:MAG TPA: hypothetical protein VOA87_16680 [Thermoanaerobaculia bacterium]|nr:hypothetical protein [Thermoanaerobaculia bacterium]